MSIFIQTVMCTVMNILIELNSTTVECFSKWFVSVTMYMCMPQVCLKFNLKVKPQHKFFALLKIVMQLNVISLNITLVPVHDDPKKVCDTVKIKNSLQHLGACMIQNKKTFFHLYLNAKQTYLWRTLSRGMSLLLKLSYNHSAKVS